MLEYLGNTNDQFDQFPLLRTHSLNIYVMALHTTHEHTHACVHAHMHAHMHAHRCIYIMFQKYQCRTFLQSSYAFVVAITFACSILDV